MNTGALLRERRRAHRLSQDELAIRAGTRQATISRLENGHEVPTIQRLEQLLTALGERLELRAVPVDYRGHVPGAGDDADRRARSVETSAPDVVVRVVSLDDLIRMKGASGRPPSPPDIANLSPPEGSNE